MTIQKQFILRYKEFGHVRFEIPALYTESLNAKALSQALNKIEGVYRVKVFNSQGKLIKQGFFIIIIIIFVVFIYDGFCLLFVVF